MNIDKDLIKAITLTLAAYIVFFVGIITYVIYWG